MKKVMTEADIMVIMDRILSENKVRSSDPVRLRVELLGLVYKVYWSHLSG